MSSVSGARTSKPRSARHGSARHRSIPLGLFLCALLAAPVAAQESVDERLAALEAKIEVLQAELAELRAPERDEELSDRIGELERRQEVQAEEIERLDLGAAVIEATESRYGLGDAASKVYRAEQGLSFGGYGEMLFQSFDSTRDDGAASGRSDQIDFLRGILYAGYKFNDQWVFNSEVEFEHATTGEGGEVSLEFAYIDRLLQPGVNLRAGLLLVPMGFINEIHEPPLFLGATRPQVERNLIPTTWRENGFGLFGETGPFTYRTYLVNGLDAGGFSSSGIRGGRQKGSRALVEDFAWVGRLDYTATPGLLAGGSVYLGDSGQDLVDGLGRPIEARTTIWEGHVDWKWRGFEARALLVEAEVDDVARLNGALGLAGSQSIGEKLDGYYLQAGYDVFARFGEGRRALIPFARWESFDTQSEVPAGFTRDPARDLEVFTLGLSFKPLDQLVFKVEHQDFDNEAGTGVDQLNAAIGYIF